MAFGTSLLLHRPSPCSSSHPPTLPFPARSFLPFTFRCSASLPPSSNAASTPLSVAATASASAADSSRTHREPPHTKPSRNSNGNGAANGAAAPPLQQESSLPRPALATTAHAKSHAKSLANALRFGGLDVSRHSYRETFVIRCYEVGMNRTASIETIANLLQEVACDHAQSVGFSTDGFATTPSMRKRRLIWVTTRMHIEVDEYPVWGDVVQFETWCQSEGKVGTRRDWLMTNMATGKLIGRATSTWVMMNEDTRRLSRITEDVRDEYTRYCPTTPRYAFPEENSCSLKKIQKLEDPAQHIRSGLMPRRGDLDMNQHVNNVTYIGWTLESMPQHLVDTHQLHRITLDYRHECKCDDVVESLASLESFCYSQSKEQQLSSLCAAKENGAAVNGTASSLKKASDGGVEFLHVLRLAGSDIEINRGRTVWKRKAERL